MRHLTIRNVPAELAGRLEAEKHARGRSLNTTVIELLTESVGLSGRRKSNGLAALAGTWRAAELDAFEQATVFTREVDDELWS
jgi:plasmid stability protein